MEIIILGPGCPNCKKLEQVARDAVAELAVEATIRKVTDYAEIMKYPILSTPGLVIDGALASSGRIPSKAEVVSWITKALKKSDKQPA